MNAWFSALSAQTKVADNANSVVERPVLTAPRVQLGSTPAERRLLRSAGVRPALVEFVVELAHNPSAFSSFPITEREAAAFRELSPQQEQHATLALKHIPELAKLRYIVCPRQIAEPAFWRVYFLLCRSKLKWGDDPDDDENGSLELSTDPADILAACRASAVDDASLADEEQATRVWCANVAPPDDAIRNETYFDSNQRFVL